jgi:hypothetical protein
MLWEKLGVGIKILFLLLAQLRLGSALEVHIHLGQLAEDFQYIVMVEIQLLIFPSVQ